MSTYHVTLAEDIYNVAVTTVETVTKVFTNVDIYYVAVTEDSYTLITAEEEVYNVTNVVEAYNVTVGEEIVYNVTVVMSGGVTGIASISDLVPAGDFDEQTIIWSDALQVWMKNPNPFISGGSGVPEYFLIEDAGLVGGYSSLTNPLNSWNTSKALIKEIKVDTSSTNWLLKIIPKASGVSGEIPDRTVMDHGFESETIFLDLPYEDEDDSNSVHIELLDYSGVYDFDIHIIGTELL